MKNILVPCDFSPEAQAAYALALQIVERTKGRISVLSAIDMPVLQEAAIGVTPYYFDPGLARELKEEADKRFDQLTPKPPAGISVDFFTPEGPVTPVIRQFIEDHKIDLVVMGTRGASGIEEYLIGSNTEKIVRFSPVPVIAIRRQVKLSSLRKIVFPTTLDPDPRLIKHVKALQLFLRAQLHVLIVNTPHNMLRTVDEQEKMEAFAQAQGFENYTMNRRDDFREPSGIQRFAQEIEADLIVMATHGRRGLAHFFSGSIAEKVVNHVDCPVWTFSTHR